MSGHGERQARPGRLAGARVDERRLVVRDAAGAVDTLLTPYRTAPDTPAAEQDAIADTPVRSGDRAEGASPPGTAVRATRAACAMPLLLAGAVLIVVAVVVLAGLGVLHAAARPVDRLRGARRSRVSASD